MASTSLFQNKNPINASGSKHALNELVESGQPIPLLLGEPC